MNATRVNKIIYFFLAISIGYFLYQNATSDQLVPEKTKKIVIKEKMIDYDRQFLPYLYYTTVGDSQGVKQSIDGLTNAWDTLEEELVEACDVSYNSENLFISKQWLFDSFLSTDDIVHQFVCMDLSRFYLMEIRRDLEIEYCLDYLWEFEASLDLVHEPATDPMLCLLEFCELSSLVNDLNNDWKRFDEFAPGNYFFETMGISKEKLEIEKSKLEFALYDFNMSMETAMIEKIAVEVRKLDIAYNNFLKNLIEGQYQNNEILESNIAYGRRPLIK
jgi:hypothetical protein